MLASCKQAGLLGKCSQHSTHAQHHYSGASAALGAPQQSATWALGHGEHLVPFLGDQDGVLRNSTAPDAPQHSAARALGHGEYLVPILGDQDGVLILRGQLAVRGHHRPGIAPGLRRAAGRSEACSVI